MENFVSREHLHVIGSENVFAAIKSEAHRQALARTPEEFATLAEPVIEEVESWLPGLQAEVAEIGARMAEGHGGDVERRVTKQDLKKAKQRVYVAKAIIETLSAGLQ